MADITNLNEPPLQPGTVDRGIDLYGPFLRADQILRSQPPNDTADTVKLELDRFFLRVKGQEPKEPGKHERFILNAVLLDPDGQLQQRQLYEMGFHPAARSREAQQVTLSVASNGLARALNANQPEPLLFKSGNSRYPVINLAHFVEIVHITEEELAKSMGYQPNQYTYPRPH